MTNMKPALFKILREVLFNIGGFLLGDSSRKHGLLKFAEFWFRSTQMTFGQIRIMSDKDLVLSWLLARNKQTNLIQFFPKRSWKFIHFLWEGFSCQNFCTTHGFRSSRSWSCCGPSSSWTSVIRSKCGSRNLMEGGMYMLSDVTVRDVSSKYPAKIYPPWN